MHTLKDSKQRLWFESRFNIICVCASTKTMVRSCKSSKVTAKYANTLT